MSKFEGLTVWQTATLYIQYTNEGNSNLGKLGDFVEMNSNCSLTRSAAWKELYDAIIENDVSKIKRIARPPKL